MLNFYDIFQFCKNFVLMSVWSILWSYYEYIIRIFLVCYMCILYRYTWFTQPTYFIQLCWITCLLSLNLVWNIQHVHNMHENWMNKLAGDLINMLKNSNKVGIVVGKVLTGPWIINIYIQKIFKSAWHDYPGAIA